MSQFYSSTSKNKTISYICELLVYKTNMGKRRNYMDIVRIVRINVRIFTWLIKTVTVTGCLLV